MRLSSCSPEATGLPADHIWGAEIFIRAKPGKTHSITMRAEFTIFCAFVVLSVASLLILDNQSVIGESQGRSPTGMAVLAPGWVPQIAVFPEDVAPQPVDPGQDMIIKLRVHNRDERMDADHISVYLDLFGPFKYKGHSQPSFEDMNICRGCSLSNTYYLTVDSNVTSGNYPLFYILEAGGYSIRKNLSIIVIGRPNLIMTTDIFDNLSPTMTFSPFFRLTNTGTGLARFIKTSALPPNNFAMLGSSDQSLPDIPPGQSRDVVYQFSVGENTPADVYTIPIQVTYLDEYNRNYSISASIGVRVIKAAKIDLETVKITPNTEGRLLPKPNDPFSIIVRVQNVGYGDSDYTNIELTGCPLEGTNKGYVGNLKRFEDSPATFIVVAPKSGNYRCKILATYKDDIGMHRAEFNYNFYIPPSDSTIALTVVVVLIGGAGIALLAYKWRKKRQ